MISMKITVSKDKTGKVVAVPEIFYIDEDDDKLIANCREAIQHYAEWLRLLSEIRGSKLIIKKVKEYTIKGE